jgi:hypothetical protein
MTYSKLMGSNFLNTYPTIFREKLPDFSYVRCDIRFIIVIFPCIIFINENLHSVPLQYTTVTTKFLLYKGMQKNINIYLITDHQNPT